MVLSIEAIIWYLMLIDSLVCNVIAWFDGKWYTKKFPGMSKLFPITKAFAVYYFILVLWIGSALYRMQVIIW